MPDDLDCEVIFLAEARQLAKIPRAKAEELAKAGKFPGQLPRIGKRHRIHKARMFEQLEREASSDLGGDAA